MTATAGPSYLAAKFAAVRRRRADAAVGGAELAALERRALGAAPSPGFMSALRNGKTVALIAEFKRRSPSGGDLVRDTEPVRAARKYVEHGACAVSVLTDAEDFGGSLDDLAAVAAAIGEPVLRKDFVVDRAALYEARIAGAAAVLLIAGALEPGELRELVSAALAIGLEALVEVHDERELDRAVVAGAQVIGINNRDLQTLATDLATTERLAPLARRDALVVSESGIRGVQDVRRMRDAGADAVLVGEVLLRQQVAARPAFIRALAGVPR